jgi:hypothetical protein
VLKRQAEKPAFCVFGVKYSLQGIKTLKNKAKKPAKPVKTWNLSGTGSVI